jgi:ribosomal protein S18 acetylase RimI-like enzyme
MIILSRDCSIAKVDEANPILDFDCGNHDLNEFFQQDALKYHRELLGESYMVSENQTGKIVCAFSLSNDGIKTFDLPNSRKKKVREAVPREKHMKSFPATLIGRLGVSVNFARQGIGSQLMSIIKSMCLLETGNRCRFLVVDAYNLSEVLNYYENNNFQFVFSTEDQEKGYFGLGIEDKIKTRFMYFDLLAWKRKMEQ